MSEEITIHPAYRERVKSLLASITHEAPLSGEGVKVTTSEGGLEISILVEKGNHIIRQANFLGAQTELQRGLMEGLCRILENKPILEGADHAAIRLEYELRNSVIPNFIKGIILPINADKAFEQAERLTRALWKNYQEKTDYHSTENFFHPSASKEWKEIDSKKKLQKIQEVIDQFCQKHSLPEKAFEVTGIDNQVRITVKLGANWDKLLQQRMMLRLEPFLKEKLEKTIEIYTEELKDQNKIRRL